MIFLLISLLIILPVRSQTNTGIIEITITDIDCDKFGFLWIGLYNNRETFGKLDKALQMKYIPVKNKSHIIKFINVNYGIYTVNIFHDENSNRDIDKNFIGIPTEGYGFSNNPNLLGPPSFEKTKFSHLQSINRLTIKMRY